MVKKKKLEIYVDGSYSRGMVGFGWAAFTDNVWFSDCKRIGGLYSLGEEFVVKKNTYKEKNVAGEVKAMVAALDWYYKFFTCRYHIVSTADYDCKIFFDYSGLKYWLDGSWKANSTVAKWYKSRVSILLTEMLLGSKSHCSSLEFVKLKGHSGNVLHDYVDKELRSLLRSAVAEEKNKKKTKKSKVVV